MSDPVTATANVQIDNDFTRVVQWRFPPGTQTGFHIHEFDYVVVPIVSGTLHVDPGDEEFDNVLVLGESYTGSAGTAHNVMNTSDVECAFVEVEFKGRR
ncbi:cupin domain-containing protein [Janibacter limosus]|uniref:Cupin domain-containing protein n=1 Tax=Janibacter limosus TaxID=53458 RepID=A0AC61U2S6_9MICO|nr:cupin domain-containing protein [Janibacter limosus]UUZ44320.1 cupin domain-containing protein [Janibacter limosus]